MPIDYRRYPKNWAALRSEVLKRAQHHCEVCGAHNYQPHPETGSKVILTLAHLDHDETNPDVQIDRLKAMCQRCHFAYDREDNARRRALNKAANERSSIRPTRSSR